MSTEVQPQPQPHPASPDTRPPAPRWSKRRAALIGMVVVIAAGLFVIGTLPRLRQKAVLAADVKQVQTAIPTVTVVTPSLVSAGGLSLPGNIQALKDSAINA